jgi:hypothetical protein
MLDLSYREDLLNFVSEALSAVRMKLHNRTPSLSQDPSSERDAAVVSPFDRRGRRVEA